jgi:hypothetical protein
MMDPGLFAYSTELRDSATASARERDPLLRTNRSDQAAEFLVGAGAATSKPFWSPVWTRCARLGERRIVHLTGYGAGAPSWSFSSS